MEIDFSSDMLEYIVFQFQTSLFANRDKNNEKFKITERNLQKVLGNILLSGYHNVPEEQQYLPAWFTCGPCCSTHDQKHMWIAKASKNTNPIWNSDERSPLICWKLVHNVEEGWISLEEFWKILGMISQFPLMNY